MNCSKCAQSVPSGIAAALQEIYRVDRESGKQVFCAQSCRAAVRSLSAVVVQLHAHMLASQQQQRLPAVYTPVVSEISRVADHLDKAMATAQPSGETTNREGTKLNSLVKAFRSSFRRRSSGEDKSMLVSGANEVSETRLDLGSDAKLSAREGSKSSRASEEAVGIDSPPAESIVAAGFLELRSSAKGQQCLLKALLQQEGLRVLENCLAACLAVTSGV